MTEPFPLAPSLWAATAPPPPETPPLDSSTTADVCIIGGGYAGLSTALHLAEQGVKAVVLEAREPGWGASGRNGGQVIPGIKYDPDELERMFPDSAEELIDFVGGTADAVFDLIGRHKLAVPHVRAGWIQGAHTPASVATVQRRAEQWRRRGVDADFLDRTATDRALGTPQYDASWIDRRGGAVQPLAYARELARVALAAGATIHGQTRATGIARNARGWTVSAENGASVQADKVLVCTNGYTGDLVPRLRQTIIAPNSFQVATAPLSDNLRRSILPEGQVTSDTRKLLLYFRLDHTGRFIMGGRGPFREPSGSGDWAHLERVLVKMFPQLQGTPIEYRWCGRVALTRDFVPHLHEPEPGLVVDIGCMGRGIALQSALGARLARYLATGQRSVLPFPMTAIKPLPLHAVHRAYVAAIIAWYRLTDGGVRASPRTWAH
jgi:glycine/D-amino acid oxidase-like deaminating enzyme